MSFVSWPFIALFSLVLLARLSIGRRKIEPAYMAVLLAAGAVFYAWFVPWLLLILVGSTSVDYAASLMLSRVPRERVAYRRLLLCVSIGVNLGLLGLFKYGNLVLHTVGNLAEVFHIGTRPTELNLILPIGISFYTFEAMSYTIDVYRGELRPVRNFARFFLFISFFPHLVAGPIVRAYQFLPQIDRPRRLRWPVVCEGVWLMSSGFFLKMVCADNLAQYVNRFWPEAYGPHADATTGLWLAMMFSGQIFADFAGYSNIGRGAAYLLGFRLPINFNAPYVAGSFKNFWERWHITLSQWLRDYLYRPLGGNRSGRRRTYVNLLLVMLIGGLWHGAAFRFIAWGAVHGVALAMERSLGLHRDDRRGPIVSASWFVVVQLTVLVAWILFRSDSLTLGWQFLGNLARLDFRAPTRIVLSGSVFLLPIVVHHVWTWLEERGRVDPLGPLGRAAVAGVMLFTIPTLGATPGDFIYFQF
jgi:D-alanyl-lipoteichoic acid acyltransferase DltB (MBOAT superfamily)